MVTKSKIELRTGRQLKTYLNILRTNMVTDQAVKY